MAQHYCPRCWEEVAADAAVCPGCGLMLADAAAWSYDERLVNALDHRLPDRRLTAARILGERRHVAAVPRLVEILRSDPDVYLRAEAAVALVRIADPGGLAAVEDEMRDRPGGRADQGVTRPGLPALTWTW